MWSHLESNQAPTDYESVELTNVMSERVKIGSVESKKGLLFFITALSFGFKWSVKWKLVKATETAQRNKANDWSETA